MSTRIRFVPEPARMVGSVVDVPAFPGEFFTLNAPEVIGDASQVVFAMDLPPSWTDLGGGQWRANGHVAGELEFALTVTPGSDSLDVDIQLTNRSTRVWNQSLAFPCFNCSDSPSIADFECARHWVRANQQFQRLTQVRRRYSTRPTIQAYSVEGATPATQIPFVSGFQATPDALLEGWLAIQARTGDRLAAVVSRPGLFLFQNMEYSCIHCGPSFGTLSPGQSGQALTRIYLVESTLDDWYRRMKLELG